MISNIFPKKEVGPWFNPDNYRDSYRDRLGSKNLPIGGFFAFYAPKVFSILIDFSPFFPKKEVGPWFNPDNYRDRLGSKNLPIGGFFAFWGAFICAIDRPNSPFVSAYEALLANPHGVFNPLFYISLFA